MSAETPLLLPTPHSVQRVRQRRRAHLDCCSLFRLVLPASVIAAFLLFVLTLGIIDQTSYGLPWNKKPDVVFPNFSHYKYLRTLPHTHFPIHSDDDKRVIVIGDIHGMNHSLSELLAEISYDPQSDALIHLGDIVSKNTDLSSDPLLTFLSTNHILGVRGNNDQKVIEWRAWMDWIKSLPGGREWLADIDSTSSHVDGDESNARFNTWRKKSHKKWQAYVPDGWKLQGQLYRVARDMSQVHYDYLRSLPLVLHAPTAHTYFVHAGLLAADPTLEASDPRQPLSHFPTTNGPKDDDLSLRRLQEVALLNEIPQNQDPWVIMNMRSLSKKGKVKNGKNGIPWSDLWNDVMDGCSCLPSKALSADLSEHSLTTRTCLECFPSMVMYGHAAARGLDVKRWSIGLDTGCTYGRRLSAVVLDAKSLFPQHLEALGTSLQGSLIPYGDNGTAQIVNVKCHA